MSNEADEQPEEQAQLQIEITASRGFNSWLAGAQASLAGRPPHHDPMNWFSIP